MKIDVTILLVVRNAEKYISECIESVLSQTYTDFEFLIVDNVSTDNTVNIIKSFVDFRIRLILNQQNYIEALNTGMSLAKGKYIARIDADDKMFPDRIKEQVQVMTTFPDVDICGSWAVTFGSVSCTISNGQGRIENPIAELLRRNFICHPSTLLKKKFFIENNLKHKNYEYAEDYKLWLDAALSGGVFYIIPHPLIQYRMSKDQVSYRKRHEQDITAKKIRNEILLIILNDKTISVNAELQNIYMSLEKINNEQKIAASDVIEIMSFIYKSVCHNQ